MGKFLKLYAISGLGADHRVFQFLNLQAEIIYLNWLEPEENESLQRYAHRLAEKIDPTEPFGLIGVSFGGLIATEIARKFRPKCTILVSSTDVKNGLRQVYGWVGKMRILTLIPPKRFDMPKVLAQRLFGAKNKKLLADILDDSDLNFTKWAVIALTKWNNDEPLINGIKINGTKDLLIPGSKGVNRVLIENGTHFMIVDLADEVSEAINTYLNQTISKT